jgi:WD40 repeat protein
MAIPAEPGSGSVADPAPAFPIRFGDYLLEALISHGGMGVVYRARQTSLDRTVALKLLLLGRYSSPESIKRFRREAQSAAALRHPHIVSIFEVGEADGQPFLAMEFVDGRSLAEVLRQGPLSPRQAAEYARVIADAIHYAHSRGVLHRDVKPSNVLLDAFDQVRLTDFGLAKKIDGSGDLTVTGEILGSPNYLSPEQAEGRHAQVGPPTDIYGVGALLYELLTGRPPFMAQSIQDTLLHIRDTDPVAPQRLNPAVPRDLNTITLKCLQKQPGRRYATAGDLAADLGRFLSNEPIQAHPTSAWERNVKWVQRHRARAAVVATVALSLIALATGSLWFSFHVQRARNETEAANRRLARDLFVREWNDAEQSLDGGKTIPALIWFARTVRAVPSNHVAATRLLSLLGELTLSIPAGKPLVHSNAVLTADFSPDGRHFLSASANGQVRVWPWREESPPVLLPKTFDSPATAWIPEIDRILVADHSGVSLWTPDGALDRHQSATNRGILRWELTRDGRRAALISSDRPPQLWDARELLHLESPAFADASVRAATLAASGRYLFRSWVTQSPKSWNIGLWDVASGRRVWEATPPETPRSFHVHSAAISDDESLVAFCRWGGQTMAYRVPPLEVAGTTVVHDGPPLLQWDFGEVTRVETFRFLDRNRRLLVATTDGLVQQFDLATGQILPDRIEHSGQVNAAPVSPDGTTLATASVDGLVRFWDLRVRRSEPVILRRSNVVWNIAFAPDNSALVVGGDPDAAICDPASGAVHLRLPMGGLVSRVAYSPDGRRVATSTERGILRIWDPATGKPVTPALPIANRIHDLCYSPDGKWIIVGGPSDRVRVLDAETATSALPDFSTGASIVETVVTADLSRLVAGTVHGDVHFWSLPDAKAIPAQGRHRGVVWATRASRDGRRIATASGDQTVFIWEASSARVLREFRSEKAVYAAEFSPDGTKILVGSADRTARIRDVETGRQTSEIMRHAGGVWFVRFSPDGRLVATGDDAGFARLWDAESGLPVGNWLRSDSTLKRIEFSPDGRRIATASSDQTVRIWPVVVAPSPAPDWLPDLAEAIAGRRLDADDNLHPVPFEIWRAARDRFTSFGDRGPDFYARWARWFFVERLAETPAPFIAVP